MNGKRKPVATISKPAVAEQLDSEPCQSAMPQDREAKPSTAIAWESFILASLIGVIGGSLAYILAPGNQTYPDFIVGYMAWREGVKTPDYVFFYFLAAVFAIVFAADHW